MARVSEAGSAPARDRERSVPQPDDGPGSWRFGKYSDCVKGVPLVDSASVTQGMKFRLSRSTLGFVFVDSGKRAIKVPTDSVIEVLTGEVNELHMVEVDWQGTRVMLFVVDVQERGIPVKSSHSKG